MNKKIYIVGHSNPDIDSIFSSMLMKDILKLQGFNCECGIFENDIISDEYFKIANLYGEYKPEIIKLEDVDKNQYVLVDHNDISTTIKNKDLVIGIIDHHKNTGWDETKDNFWFLDRCSTTISIYQLFKDDYKFSENQKEQIMLGVAFDSKFGKSSKYETMDKFLVMDLNAKQTLSDCFCKYFKPSDLSTDKILQNERKPIKIGDKIYESCSLTLTDQDGFKPLYDAIKNDNNNNFIGLISNINKETTTVIIKEDGEIKHIKNFNELYSRKNLEKDFKNFDEKNIEKDLEK